MITTPESRREFKPPTPDQLRNLRNLAVEIRDALNDPRNHVPEDIRIPGIVRTGLPHDLTVGREVNNSVPGRYVVSQSEHLPIPRSEGQWLNSWHKVYRISEDTSNVQVDQGIMRDTVTEGEYARLIANPRSVIDEAEWDAEIREGAADEMAAAVPGANQPTAKEISDLIDDLDAAWQIRRVELGIPSGETT